MIKGTAKTILSKATEEEMKTFDKINRSTEAEVKEAFGKDKKEILNKFMGTWIARF